MNKLFANLLKYKENTKVSVGIKFGKGLLTSCVSDSLTSMIQWLSAVSPVIPSNGAIEAISIDWIDKTLWYHYLSRMESGW